MIITIIGCGYVGLVTGVCLSKTGNTVICVDSDKQKIKNLEKAILPMYESQLAELINFGIKENRLSFTSDIDYAVKKSDICFIAVGTPQSEDGSADLQYVYQAAQDIGKSINGYKVIVNKSTAPVGTVQKITEIIKKYTNQPFDVISNPEFLRQGSAVANFLSPDRIVIGSNSDKATLIMKNLYSPFLNKGQKIIVMDIKSAEITKYASNSFLATKISFMNELANLCERVGASIDNVRLGMSEDKRIGNKFLFSGLGYGGSCFPKDINALIKTGQENNIDMKIIKATNEVNNKQRIIFTDKIFKKFGTDLSNRTFAVWGLSFKPKTSDMRDAPSITVINKLLEHGAKIKAFDPKTIEIAKDIFYNKIEYSTNAYDALTGADSLILLTEWEEFKHPDFEKIKRLLKNPVIFDGRNQYIYERLKEKGVEYYNIGN